MIELILIITQNKYFWLSFTIFNYLIFELVSIRFNRPAYLNSTLLSVIIISISLKLLNITYIEYLQKLEILRFMLSLTIVAFAVPLYENTKIIIKNWKAIFATLIAANIASYIPTVIYIKYFNTSHALIAPLMGKSATSPVNMAISEITQSNISLAAIFFNFNRYYYCYYRPINS